MPKMHISLNIELGLSESTMNFFMSCFVYKNIDFDSSSTQNIIKITFQILIIGLYMNVSQGS